MERYEEESNFQYVVHLNGGGDIRLGILGSINPYRQKLGLLNNLSSGESASITDGIEFVLGKGAKIHFGGQEATCANESTKDTIVVESGLLMMTAPTTVDVNEDSKDALFTELVIAKLVGGVRVGIGVAFMVADAFSTLEFPQEIPPWKVHSEIMLMTPDAVAKLRQGTRPNRRITAFGKGKEDVCRNLNSRSTMHIADSERVGCESLSIFYLLTRFTLPLLIP